MRKIAILSDIHFGSSARTSELSLPWCKIKGESTNACSLTNSLIDIFKEQDVGYIIISGDLTSSADPLEFHYCSEKILEIATSAGIPKENIIWSIGNHDIDWSITRIADGIANQKEIGEKDRDLLKTSYRIAALYAAKNNARNLPALCKEGIVPLSGIYETDKFVVFVLNSALYSTHDQEIKHGRLSKEQLKWFENEASGYDERWKIVVTHHHPIDYAYPTVVFDISKMEDGAEFAEIAGAVGIDVVIHGHRHHPYAFTTQSGGWKKPITFICSGSLSVNVEERGGEIPNTFHILELTDTIGTLKMFNYEYSESDGWKAIQYRKEAPLDSEMHLGKVIDTKAMEEAARALWGSITNVKRISIKDLPEELSFCTFQILKETLEKTKPSDDSDINFDPEKKMITMFKEQ